MCSKLSISVLVSIWIKVRIVIWVISSFLAIFLPCCGFGNHTLLFFLIIKHIIDMGGFWWWYSCWLTWSLLLFILFYLFIWWCCVILALSVFRIIWIATLVIFIQSKEISTIFFLWNIFPNLTVNSTLWIESWLCSSSLSLWGEHRPSRYLLLLRVGIVRSVTGMTSSFIFVRSISLEHFGVHLFTYIQCAWIIFRAIIATVRRRYSFAIVFVASRLMVRQSIVHRREILCWHYFWLRGFVSILTIFNWTIRC